MESNMAIKKIGSKNKPYCVIHCYRGKDVIIACHHTYKSALAQHRAIMVYKRRRKKNV